MAKRKNVEDTASLASWWTATTCRPSGPWPSRPSSAPARGEGPTLIEAKTFRIRPHSAATPTESRPAELIDHWQQKDPITTLATRLTADHGVDPRPAGGHRPRGGGRDRGRRAVRAGQPGAGPRHRADRRLRPRAVE